MFKKFFNMISISLIIISVFINLGGTIRLAGNEKKIVCYYGTWAVYRHSRGQFGVEHIDPTICTHLIYSFFGISEAGDINVLDPYLDLEENWGRGNIMKFNQLKRLNPSLKTIAAIGGWNEGSRKFSIVANDELKRKTFAQNTLEFLKKHNFDGFDLDWEYPGQRDGNPNVDRAAFVLVLEELYKTLQPHGLTLSAAVSPTKTAALASYDIPKVIKYLDFVNLMVYDLHGSWETYIGNNAPLYAGSADTTDFQRQLNADTCVKYWLSEGAPSEKLILGMPLYGRTFTLANPANNKPGAANNGPGNGGPYTNQPGMLGYNEFCEQKDSWTIVWDDEQMVPYAYKGNQWIGYDDIKSVEIKSNYINSLNLGGAMVWSIETDDFLGLCGNGNFSLLKTIQRLLNGGTATLPPPTTTAPSSSTESVETLPVTENTTPDNSSFSCVDKTGYYRDPIDCVIFYYCDGNIKYKFNCPKGLCYDASINACNWPNLTQNYKY